MTATSAVTSNDLAVERRSDLDSESRLRATGGTGGHSHGAPAGDQKNPATSDNDPHAFMHYNLSTAVWVGLIAVAGVAAETGIVMVVYLDEAFERYMREGRIQKPDDVDVAVVEGASARVRPLLMTVATTVLGLLPLLWEAGVGLTYRRERPHLSSEACGRACS